LASTFPRWKQDTAPPFVYNLSSGLAQKGHEVHVLAPHTKGAAAEEELGLLRVHRFRYAPVRWESLCYDGGILQNLRRKPALWSIVPFFLSAELMAALRIIRRHRIELVHAHWFIPQGFVAALSNLIKPLPLIVTGHGGDVLATRGKFRKSLVRFAAKRADVCTVNSRAMSDEAQRLTGCEMRTIPMGVDQSKFRVPSGSNAVRKHEDEFPKLLFVGRLVEKKGVKYLIKAMPELIKSYPEATLTIVGDGPEKPELERLSLGLGVSSQTRFTGSVPNDSLHEYYGSSDIFAAPSIVGADGDSEALGVVILEAAASGVPIVATNVGGIPDIIEHGVSGLLVGQKNPYELAQAIVYLADHNNLRQKFSVNARQHIESNFSWDSVVDRFDAVYRELLVKKETVQGENAPALR
jgi:glycosyltransferase involved in cell wall biosynthesis